MSDDRIQRIAEAIAPLRVEPGRRVRLDRDCDPRYKAGIVKKKDGGAGKLHCGSAVDDNDGLIRICTAYPLRSGHRGGLAGQVFAPAENRSPGPRTSPRVRTWPCYCRR